MRHVLLLLAFLISGAISQPVYAYQDALYHVMTSDSISLYLHVKGEGPMCLYLHGGPGSGSSWIEAVSGHMLEKRFTMVYLDQRGVCKSETPKNDDFSFARQIQDREEVRQAFGEADVQTFCQIFDSLSNDGINDPAELYRKGVMEYLNY